MTIDCIHVQSFRTMYAKWPTHQHHSPSHQQCILLVLPLGFKHGHYRSEMDALTTLLTLFPHRRYVTRGDVSFQEEVGITGLDKHNFVTTGGQFKPCTWSNPRAFGPQQLPSPFVRSLHTSPARLAKKNKNKNVILLWELFYSTPGKKFSTAWEYTPSTSSKMHWN